MMAKETEIAWTDSTLNFWWGCLKVSPGCEHCYAETFSKRVGRNIWGPAQTTERWRTKAPWTDCLKWDRQAKADEIRRKVFCMSMGDFLEDHPQLVPWREEACKILERFEWLDVQLLTKRPENAERMLPAHWFKSWPQHIQVGVSIENQKQADKRIPQLLQIPAAIHFLSCEPLLGPLNLDPFFWHNGVGFRLDKSPTWVIIGGESGPNARPFDLDWAWGIIQQCQGAGVAAFMKQLGSRPRMDNVGYPTKDRKGSDPAEWPAELRVREFPTIADKDSRVSR